MSLETHEIQVENFLATGAVLLSQYIYLMVPANATACFKKWLDVNHILQSTSSTYSSSFYYYFFSFFLIILRETVF